ncbi:malate:quinone oxidoreductase, partial [Vibrio parahaemolyticus]|nr:malate:quinone oxidoreductase [Vibrio parahaemolyticus]
MRGENRIRGGGGGGGGGGGSNPMNKKMAVPRSQAVGPNSTRTNTRHEQETDVLLIGGGIMSATLGTWLQELEPDWSITMVEQMSSVAEESSNGWNNAGT